MTELRWRQADRPQDQGALFDEPVFEREPGRGEFRGMEFLHVRAHRIINEVPAAPFGFRYTINAYRGCSHACTYCLAGETPVLMADGSARPLADVRPGDAVFGTVRDGAGRRCVPTSVIDHWSTVKPAYRLTLADDTPLVASGDHRFLTDRGWKHVTRTGLGSGPRPHLTRHHSLLGVDGLGGITGDALAGPAGAAVTGGARRRVVGIEPLGADLPLFDITTGTGDFIANGVVSHNCFARPTHTYLDLDADRDFERRIVVKVNAVSRLRHELDPRRWAGDLIAMGTNTDPYQRAEGKYRLTRGVVEALVEQANPFSILTKSTLVLRDLELLAEAARRTDVRVNLSIGTLDEAVWRATEPGTPHPTHRVRAVERLNAAGVPTGVLVAPVLPDLSDDPAQLEAVVRACVEAGARSISSVLLHLRPGVKEVFLGRLAETHPHLMASYRRRYRDRAYAPKAEHRALDTRIHELVRRHGGLPAERTDPRHHTGRDPAPDVAPQAPSSSQLRLI
ncbi:MAG TPA: radical SAM protein [Acidimicrobiales bacterium]|nr:radical SAM protein [Acidimicrobiales bacterium]